MAFMDDNPYRAPEGVAEPNPAVSLLKKSRFWRSVCLTCAAVVVVIVVSQFVVPANSSVGRLLDEVLTDIAGVAILGTIVGATLWSRYR